MWYYYVAATFALAAFIILYKNWNVFVVLILSMLIGIAWPLVLLVIIIVLITLLFMKDNSYELTKKQVFPPVPPSFP